MTNTMSEEIARINKSVNNLNKKCMEVHIMAKMERKEIVVKDIVKNIEYKSMSEQTPRQTEPGNYIYLKLNPIGIDYLQKQGQVDNTVSTKAFEEWFCVKTGMPKEGIGQLGNLKDVDAASKWEVKVAGVMSFPRTPVVAPVVMEQPMIAQQPAMAMTDTTISPVQEKIISQIRTYLAEGKTKEQLVAGLSVKMSPLQAVELISRAEMPVVVAQPTPAFDFSF